ncbi:hypothetical protein F5141DRAFT_1206320 [Pisolithus sp. B1]|nr:hypothetical protein F5141DRAFT_1206320 [Pisolithus sp. B1]
MPLSFRAVKIPDLPFGKQPSYPRIGEEEPSLQPHGAELAQGHFPSLQSFITLSGGIPLLSSVYINYSSADNRGQVLKRYADEIAGVVVEAIARCKTDKGCTGCGQASFTPALVNLLSSSLAAPPGATLSTLAPDRREKEDVIRVLRQRPVLREWCGMDNENYQGTSVFHSLGVCTTSTDGGSYSMTRHCPPYRYFSTFLKSYGEPYLGFTPLQSKQAPSHAEPSRVCDDEARNAAIVAFDGGEGLVEQDMRDHSKRMKLAIKHKVNKLVSRIWLAFNSYSITYYHALCKEGLPTKAVRPKSSIPKSIEEATKAVDDVFNVAIQNAGRELISNSSR